MAQLASPPATPPRTGRTSVPSSPSFSHPFSATAKASAGMHPSFSKDHYQSPSHMAKVERLKSPETTPQSASATTPRSFGRCKSAPAAAASGNTLLNSPAAAASSRLQDIVEEHGRSEMFSLELAGSNREERKRIQSQASLFGGSLGEAFSDPSLGGQILLTGDDDDCDWPAGQADADGEPSAGFLSPAPSVWTGPRSRTLPDLPPTLAMPFSPKLGEELTPDERSDELFEKEIEAAVEGARGTINLIDCGLTGIPSAIKDLSLITNLGGTGGNLAASTMRYKKTPRRTVSSPSALLPSPPLEAPFDANSTIALYLMRNNIRTLPLELFLLTNLTVLSLRQNGLESIPPAIGQLYNLMELNLANNKLRYLPAEILSLSLDKGSFTGNPWLVDPPLSESLDSAPPVPVQAPDFLKRKLGPLVLKSAVPSLRELCLRVLHPLDPSQRDIHPHSQALHDRFYQDKLGLHNHLDLVYVALSRCVCDGGFFEPAEERIEWTAVLRDGEGKPRGDKLPVLWRGCRRGCLELLDESADSKPRD